MAHPGRLAAGRLHVQFSQPDVISGRDGTEMKLEQQMDKIYRELTLDEIPWNLEQPPEALTDLVESGWVTPCDAVDLGCGAGNYAIWFASKGFRMTGLDLSPNAIELAAALAAQKGVACRFMARDMTGAVEDLDDAFDFAYDWEVLHHVFPEDREQYASSVHRMLRTGGKYHSLCFSEKDPPSFGGDGKYRETPLGTTLYLSSESELRELFESLFHVERVRTIEVVGKMVPHMAVELLMSKKDI
jgi:SAM-dependent methyltransferase